MNKLTKKLAIGAFALSLGISSTYAVSKSKHQHNHIDDTQLTNSASNLSIGKPSLQSIVGVGGLICNVISIGLSIAQLCKSGPAEQLKKMVNILNSINEKVDVIDSKLNEMMDYLTTEFTALQIQFNGAKVKEDLAIINNFDSTVLDRYLTQLKTSINRKFLDFSVASTYSYKDTYSADYGYFLGELSGKTGVNVNITGEEVEEAVEDANSEMSININNIEEWTILVGKKLLENPDVENKLAPVLKKRQDSGFEDTTFISAFTSGFQDFLLDQFAIEIFSSSSSYQTYAASVLNSFNSYCLNFSTPASPLALQYDIYENVFCFQKDANYIDQDTKELRNLFVDTGYLYLNNFLQFANFTEQVAYLSGLIDSSTISDLEDTILTTYKYIVATIQNHYKVDESGKPIDNYCYRTKCPIEVVKNHVTTNKPTTAEIEKNSGKIDLQGDEKGVVFGDLQVNQTKPEYRLNADEVTYLSMMERTMPILMGDTRPSFNEYLNNVLNADITTNLAIEFDQPKTITDPKGYVYNAYSFGDPTNPDMKGGMFYNNCPDGFAPTQIVIGDSGYNGKYEIVSSNLLKKTEIRGDYFDFDKGMVVHDDSIYSYGFYYDEHDNWDDIGYFSSSTIAGKKNEVTTFNTGKCDKLPVNTCVYKDAATTINITKNYDSDVYTHTITTDFDICSLNKVETKYGKYELKESPFINALSTQNKKYVEDILFKLGYDEMLPYKNPSNDGDYWVFFDKFTNPTDYPTYSNFIASEKNLNTLRNETMIWQDTFNASFKALNNGQERFDSGLSGDKLNSTVNKVVSYMDAAKEAGADIGEYVKPSSSASDFKIYVGVKPQVGEILKMENGEVAPSFVKNYVITPILSYVESGDRVYHSLPSNVSALIDLYSTGVNINLPVAASDSDLSVKQAVDIEFNQNVANYGFESSKIGSAIKNDKSAPYITQSITALGVYSATGLADGLNIKFQLVPGEEPKCNANGFKTAYLDVNSGIYYSAPVEGAEIGDENAYRTWKTSGLGVIPMNPDAHHYVYTNHTFSFGDEQFTINFECSDCEDTKSITDEGIFVMDTPATCKEAKKGHYYADGVYQGTPYYVLDDNEYTIGDPLDHKDLVHHEAIAPSCATPGNEEYYECPDCGEKFKDAQGTIPCEDPIIPATGHQLQHFDAKEPTPEERGNKEYWHCTVCDCYFLDEGCTERTTLARVIIPKTSWIYKEVELVEPTHFKAGHRAYWYCEKDGKFYSDKNGVEEITDIDAWLSEGGDGYIAKEACTFDGEISYTVNGDYCTASRHCTHPGCTELESEKVTAKYVEDTPASCTSNALGHIEAVFTNPDFGTYVTPLNSYEFPSTATGHHFENPKVEWHDRVCTVSGECADCHKPVSFAKEGTIAIDTPATCHSNAIGHYEAIFNIHGVNIAKSESFEIPNTMLDHEYGDFQVTWDGNACKVTGKCVHDGCDDIFTSYKEGTIVIDTPATCTEDAKGHYVAVFDIEGVGIQKTPENSIVIPNSALGHHYENGECTRCHEKDPNGNYINELNSKNSALTAVVIVFSCLSGLGIITSAVFGIRLFKSKKKETVSK